MTSKIKVDNINKVSDDSNIIKKCGTTTTIGSGASNPIVVDGSAVTLGRCGGTVALASGATQTGFGRTGTVNWVTTAKTTGFTAVSGEGYFCNTTGGAFTLTLPSSPSPGDIVGLKDYNVNFSAANLTIGRGGSPINGGNAADVVISTAGASIFLVYVDASQGWVPTQDDSSTFSGESFMIATGGTITTCGNCKIHTFTSPGTFTVCSVATCATNNIVSHLVVAGGGGAGYDVGGGAGAGGFREVKSPVTPYTASPLDGYPSAPNRVTVTATGFPITVGAGGAGSSGTPSPAAAGSVSTFSTITSAGGGIGGNYPGSNGGNGGSGGGGAGHCAGGSGGSGNTPSTTPAQGTNGGSSGGGSPRATSSGGGGATAAGAAGSNPPSPTGVFTPRAAGATTEISGSSVEYAQGGRGANDSAPNQQAGGDNTGTGGDGAGNSPSIGNNGAAGGSGIVIIRYKFQ